LHTNDREDFLTQLKSSVSDAGVRRFGIRFSKVAWYPNYERSRWFMSLGAAKPNGDELNRLLQVSNQVCHTNQQPELYVPMKDDRKNSELQSKKQKVSLAQRLPDVSSTSSGQPDYSDSFHISLAWSLEAQTLSTADSQAVPEELQTLSVNFDRVKVKIGNSITSLPLKTGRILQQAPGA
jgi:hypothetical protein